MNSQSKIWNVSELSSCIKELIEDGFFPLWLKGEVGNLTIHRSGHVYFTLKDERSQISAVYFSGSTEFNRHKIQSPAATASGLFFFTYADASL